MNLIYIVEPEDIVSPHVDIRQGNSGDDYRPNFTIPGKEPPNGNSPHLDEIATPELARKSWSAAQTVGVVAALAGGPYVRLLVAAASAAPAILQLLSRTSDEPDKTDGSLPTGIVEEARAVKGQAIENFLSKHAITIELAKHRGYQFPPGHPSVGQSYKLHPLAELPGSGKAGVYIPQESYDETLLEEREAELLRLLVELGATKVTIAEKLTGKMASNLSGDLGVDVTGVAGANIKAASSSNMVSDSFGTREFELVGKPWQRGDKLDRSKFGWLAFEPSWGAMIVAREVGECTKAAIEIKEETVFANEKRIYMEVKAKLTGGKAALDYLSDNAAGRTYFVKAEFAPFLATDSSTR